MRKYALTAAAVGFNLNHWERFLGLGVAAGVVYLAYLRLVVAMNKTLLPAPVPDGSIDHLTRGSAILWFFNHVVGCLGEEFWRAFCLVSLERVHRGAAFAVVATSLAFALGHYQTGHPAPFTLGLLFSYTLFGMLFGGMFFWTGSIVPTYIGHLLINSVTLYQARRKRATGGSETSGSTECV
jgi:membrane protease YdiL (CAAX protease family)